MYFSGRQYYTPELPYYATQIGCFRTDIGEAGFEELLKATIETAVHTKRCVRPNSSASSSTPLCRRKPPPIRLTAACSTLPAPRSCRPPSGPVWAKSKPLSKEGKALRCNADGHAHAKQFKRLSRTVNWQRTILSIVLHKVQRKLPAATSLCAATLSRLNTLLERAERIRTQQPIDKSKLFALHALEPECIGKGKAREPYELGVKASIAVTHGSGLVVGARTCRVNPYDGHILSAQLEQTGILLEEVGRTPKS